MKTEEVKDDAGQVIERKEYDENRRLWREWEYDAAGNLVRERGWHENGKRMYVRDYDAGKPVRARGWDVNGNLIYDERKP